MKDEKNILLEIPDNFETVLEVTTVNPNWFLKYGTIFVVMFLLLFIVIFNPIYFKTTEYSYISTIHPVLKLNALAAKASGTIDSIYVQDSAVVTKNQLLVSYFANTKFPLKQEKLYLISNNNGWIRYKSPLKKNDKIVAGQVLIDLSEKTSLFRGNFSMPFSLAKNLRRGHPLKIDIGESNTKPCTGVITNISYFISRDKKVNISFDCQLPSYQFSAFYFNEIMAKVLLNPSIKDK